MCQTHASECTTNASGEDKIEKLLDALLAGQQNIQRDLSSLASRLDSLEWRANFSAEAHAAEDAHSSQDGHRSPAQPPRGLGSGPDARPKPSPGALLKRLKRGDLRGEEEQEGNSGSLAAAIARDGVLTTLMGIRSADQRKGVEGSRLIHPNSPFFTGAPASLSIVFWRMCDECSGGTPSAVLACRISASLVV